MVITGLRRARGRAGAGSEGEASPGGNGNHRVTVRILLLEDNVALARATGLVLERAAGATVVVADSLGAATDMLDDASFDLVIADVTLPDGDGSNWGRTTRRDRGIPVVLMTAAANPEQIGVGLDGVLQKPVGLDDLLATVTRLTATS